MISGKMMYRYALCIEYCGTDYCGWQRQANAPTVQQEVEAALARLDKSSPTLTGAGRTDSGVHAARQVAHCSLARHWDPFRLCEALNAHLRPAPIAVLEVAQVDHLFSARRSAVMREYRYRLINRRAPLALEPNSAWHVRPKLDHDAMLTGVKLLLGKHDFTTFRSAHCQALSPRRTLDEVFLEVYRLPSSTEITFTFRARSFLHRQVRSIMGTLVQVGLGNWRPEDVKIALEARDRTACGPVAPARGLYLWQVYYVPDPFSRESQ